MGEHQMAFVHSLVKAKTKGKRGWYAPAELGEASPHYINFVIPLDDRGALLNEYICETITTDEEGTKSIYANKLVRHGEASFVLRLGRLDLWFIVRTVPREERRLPYIGKLEHADFAFLLREIEPEEPDGLDQLYDKENTFIIGCEPFSHYSGIRKRSGR
jgi:hypothetical protein